MTVYGLWQGGTNYPPPKMLDLEVFPSLRRAMLACDARRHVGIMPQLFKYADGREELTVTPDVDDASTLQVFLEDPRGKDILSPDRVYVFGPRGGLKVSIEEEVA